MALDGDDIHDGICGNFTRSIITGKSPATIAELTEAVRIMFAIEESLLTGKPADPNALEQVSSISSTAFMADYGK